MVNNGNNNPGGLTVNKISIKNGPYVLKQQPLLICERIFKTRWFLLEETRIILPFFLVLLCYCCRCCSSSRSPYILNSIPLMRSLLLLLLLTTTTTTTKQKMMMLFVANAHDDDDGVRWWKKNQKTDLFIFVLVLLRLLFLCWLLCFINYKDFSFCNKRVLI